jgi:tricarballylate dehydrogenase
METSMNAPTPTTEAYDVVVAGAGTAGLSAALAANEEGARVLLLEAAPKESAGGNTAFSDGMFRFTYRTEDEVVALVPDEDFSATDVGVYTESDFLGDLMRLSNDMTDPSLGRLLVQSSYPTARWLQQLGVRWALATGRWSFEVAGVRRFWSRGLICEVVGGGAGLVNQLTELAVSRGVDCRYDHRAVGLHTSEISGQIAGLIAMTPAGRRTFEAGAVVLAAGGFEANAEMRARYLGPDWDLVKVRGSRFNVGDGLKMALDAGAEPYGHWSSCHATAWDIGAPDYGRHDDPNTFARHSYPFGIVVNANGARFLDEGADLRSYTYAKYGREILRQPQRVAFQIFDNKVEPLLREQYRARDATVVSADTIEDLAEELMLDPEVLAATVADYNMSCGEEPFDPSVLDGKRTTRLTPPKSNWANPISEPPFLGYPVTTAITFTFGGVRIDAYGAVTGIDGRPVRGLYAAGELVGGMFYGNYPGGSALMSAASFGRLSGRSAARSVTTPAASGRSNTPARSAVD